MKYLSLSPFIFTLLLTGVTTFSQAQSGELTEVSSISNNLPLDCSEPAEFVISSSVVETEYTLLDENNNVIDGPYKGTDEDLVLTSDPIINTTKLYITGKTDNVLVPTKAIQLNATDYIKVNTGQEKDITSTSFEFWFKFDPSANLNTPYDLLDIDNSCIMSISPNNKRINFAIISTGDLKMKSTWYLSLPDYSTPYSWNHIAFTFEQNTISVFLNGSFQSNSDLSPNNFDGNTNFVQIGKVNTDIPEEILDAGLFGGQKMITQAMDISNIRYWDKVLSNNEIINSKTTSIISDVTDLLFDANMTSITKDSTINNAIENEYSGLFQNTDESSYLINGHDSVITDVTSLIMDTTTVNKGECITTSLSTSNNLKVTFTPNPVKSILTLSKGLNDIKIKNIRGQLIWSTTIEKTQTIDLSSFPSGVYILTGFNDRENISFHFIKQ